MERGGNFNRGLRPGENLHVLLGGREKLRSYVQGKGKLLTDFFWDCDYQTCRHLEGGNCPADEVKKLHYGSSSTGKGACSARSILLTGGREKKKKPFDGRV